ncbi:MAG: hypothetical protein HUU50_13025 [Candidatus Brocadiae bacterium]|nr:hypothetical protein [Candidatus Brocadiia bacterium]
MNTKNLGTYTSPINIYQNQKLKVGTDNHKIWDYNHHATYGVGLIKDSLQNNKIVFECLSGNLVLECSYYASSMEQCGELDTSDFSISLHENGKLSNMVAIVSPGESVNKVRIKIYNDWKDLQKNEDGDWVLANYTIKKGTWVVLRAYDRQNRYTQKGFLWGK